MNRVGRVAIGILAALALSLGLVAGPASARQSFKYIYSGTFVDGTGSEGGTFTSAPVGVAYDQEREKLLALVPGDPGHISKFTKAGTPDPFGAPGLGDTIAVPGGGPGNEVLPAGSVIAIDNTGGPNDGNIYTASIGSPGYIGIRGFKLDGTQLSWPVEPSREQLCGLAVDPQGDVWVAARLESDYIKLAEYTPGGGRTGAVIDIRGLAACRPTFDTAGNIYVVNAITRLAEKLDPAGHLLYQLTTNKDVHGFAIDSSNNHVFVSEGLEGNIVSEYDSLGTKLGSFGAAEPESSFEGLQGGARGIAVDPVTHEVWVTNAREYAGPSWHIEKFVHSPPVTIPTTTTEAPSLALTTATLRGVVNADGVETTDCHFEWGASLALGSTVPCEEGNSFSGSGDNAVSAQVEGLKKGATYYVRLSAKNGNEVPSPAAIVKFISQGLPVVETESVSQVNTDGARLQAQLGPNGGNTTYRFEWGTDETYGSSSSQSAPFGLLESASASAVIAGLTPGTLYHYRVVAENEAGTTYGEDLQFRTHVPEPGTDPCANAHVRQQTESSLLLDCRAYELVSAADAGGFDVESDLIAGQTPFGGYPRAEGRVLYGLHYGSVPGVAGSPTSFGLDPYLASRGPSGWTTRYVGLPADGMSDKGAFGAPLLEADPSLDRFAFGGPGICDPCFEDGSTNIPLRLPDGSLVKGMAGSRSPVADPSGEVAKRFSGDGTHFIFGSTQRFEPTAKNGELAIYDRDLVSGITQVVSTLPSGSVMAAAEGEVSELDVSADGSRVLIGQKVSSDVEGNNYYHPYMHVGAAAKSVDLAPGASSGVLFNGMSADGSRVFYTTKDHLLPGQDSDESADIYEAQIGSSGSLTLGLVSVKGPGPSNDDACSPPGIPTSWNAVSGDGKCNAVAMAGGVGAGADGSFYFLSPEQLDGAANGTTDQPNLYLVKPDSTPHFVATIDSSVGKPGPESVLGHVATIAPLTKPTASKPIFVAVDNSGGPSDGDVYVVDPAALVVKKFDSAGSPIASWGSNGSLDGSTATEGPFSAGGAEIMGIAVDSAGNLDVLTYQGTGLKPVRVFKFAQDGTFVARYKLSFDNGVQDTAPKGLAVDPAGNFYKVKAALASTVNGEVWKAAPTEGQNVIGVVTTWKAESATTGMAIDASNGNLYLGKPNGTIVLYRFNGSGEVILAGSETCKVFKPFQEAAGCPPSETFASGLAGLTGIAVDASTHHLFADLGNRVVELDAFGEQVGKPIGVGVLSGSTSVAYSSSTGTLYASDSAGAVKAFASVPLAWTPIDNPAVVHAVDDAGTHRYTDFQISPAGRYAAFASAQSLTGYTSLGHQELYRYDSQQEALDCASCSFTGAAPDSDTLLSPYGLSLTDGGQVFFTSAEPYVLRDTNQEKDAYEWSGGKIQLVSTGSSPDGSSLLSASADGTDAYFFTRETLVPEDKNGSTVKIYDARAGGGFPHDPAPLPCAASDECHGPGTQSPRPPSINTVTGSGYPPSQAPKSCKKNFVRRHGKCVKKKPKKHHHRKASHRHG